MEFKIKDKIVGGDNPALIVAELSANHLNDFDLAVNTIKAMKEAGADAVKMQTYSPDTITIDCSNQYFQINQDTIWAGQTLYELYKNAYMPWEWQPKLKKIAERMGLIVFSSPFDKSSVDFLNNIDMPVFKIASFEITDIPLIEYVASLGKPIIISTGIAKLCDIELAVETCRNVGNEQIALLKCTSAYPASLNEMNLRNISKLIDIFDVVVGLSDHSLGTTASIVSVALGAKIIEKHFILDRNLGGPDSKFSLEPYEFRQMVNSVKEAEKALGKENYEFTDSMKKNREFSRSLFVVKKIKKGEKFTKDNLKSIRPGYGLHPKYLKDFINKKAIMDISRGTPLNWTMISE